MTVLPRRKSTLVIALTGLLAAATGLAAEPHRIGSQRASGATSDVFDVTSTRFPGHTVLKVPRPGVWKQGRFHFRSDALLHRHARRLIGAIDALRRDARAGADFKRILPDVAEDPSLPGWLFMTAREGVTLEKVDPSLTALAQRQMEHVLAEARRILGRRTAAALDADPANFRFNGATADVTAWLSPLAAPVGKEMPYELIGKAGEGRNSDVYLIRNHTPGQQDLDVLKISRPYSIGRGTRIAPMALRDDMAHDVVYLAHTLRATYAKELGVPVVVRTEPSAAPGVLLQSRAVGAPLEEVETARGDAGLKTLRAAQARARTMFPRAVFSDSKTRKHVVFDKNSGAPSWFDFLDDNQPWVRVRP